MPAYVFASSLVMPAKLCLILAKLIMGVRGLLSIVLVRCLFEYSRDATDIVFEQLVFGEEYGVGVVARWPIRERRTLRLRLQEM